jgi:hypothetical protein
MRTLNGRPNTGETTSPGVDPLSHNGHAATMGRSPTRNCDPNDLEEFQCLSLILRRRPGLNFFCGYSRAHMSEDPRNQRRIIDEGDDPLLPHS